MDCYKFCSLFVRCMVVFVVIILLFLAGIAISQDREYIGGINREVESSTAASYGQVLKYDPTTGAWTAQQDSLSSGGAIEEIAIDTLTVELLIAKTDSLTLADPSGNHILTITASDIALLKNTSVDGTLDVVGWIKQRGKVLGSDSLQTWRSSLGDVVAAVDSNGVFWSAVPVTAGATSITYNAKVNEGGGITKGQPVYVSGASGNKPQVSLADNTDLSKQEYAGIAAETKTDGQNILITLRGELTGVDADGDGALTSSNEAWTDGEVLFMSASGYLTDTTPTNGRIRHIVIVTRNSGTVGQFLVVGAHIENHMAVPSGDDLHFDMGDDVGVNKIFFRNYSKDTVASLDSYGRFFPSGITLGDGGALNLIAPGSVGDLSYCGITTTLTAGYTTAIGDVVYLAVADGRLELTDKDVEATTGDVAVFVALAVATDGNSCLVLTEGWIRDDSSYDFTVGAAVFIGDAGVPTTTQSSTTGDFLRIVGHAFNADVFYFNPDGTWLEIN